MGKFIFYIAIMTVAAIILALLGFTLIHPDKAVESPPVVKVPFHNAAYATHPFLLFHSITETPGYQHGDTDPWKTWERSVLDSANASLATDFSTRWAGDYVSVRAESTSDLALAYQITGNTTYADKAREALLNMGLGDAPDAQKNMTQLLGYCLAYDWVQPYLSAGDDMAIRDGLATIADRSYLGLNWNNTRRSLIRTVDYHMQWYPIMGIAGITLNDYTNPNNLSLSSGPYDWQRVGTTDLFVNDSLHDYKKSMVSFQWDGDGNDLLGAYKMYYMDDFMWWSQIYTHYYGQNFFDVYPAARNAVMSDIELSLPDGYSNNFVSNGNVLYTYQGAFANLLSDSDRSVILNYLKSIDPGLLPYSRTLIPLDAAGPGYLYATYQDYSSLTPSTPVQTSMLDNNSSYQIFRGNWKNDSEWMGLITYDTNTLSNRNNAHHDQLSFEYYGLGDLLLADAGENRLTLDENYGAYELSHNTVAFEDPRSSFSVSPLGNSTARGIFKGSGDAGLVTPSNISSIVNTPWMELVDANVAVTSVVKDSQYTSMNLSSKIGYERCILFPESEYFIVIDRMESSQQWTYRNVFRPTSLNIVPTVDTNGDKSYTEDEIGHVNGNLTIGNTSQNWLCQPYKAEASTGQTTSQVGWSTRNPYGKDVDLLIYTVPSSEVLTEKYIGRIGGYNAQNEVFSPDVIFRSGPQNSLYRATVLLTRYSSEPQKVPRTLEVQGNGNAMAIDSQGYTDYVYTGKGNAAFDAFSTDASILFVRNTAGSPGEYTLLDGKFVDYNNMPLIVSKDTMGHMTLRQDESGLTFKVNAGKSTQITIYPASTLNVARITMDSQPYQYEAASDGGLSINVNAGEHTVEIQ